MTIGVIIVDDHELFRMGVAQALSNDEIVCVGEGASADDAVRLVEQTRPDVAILDLSMPGGGLVAARRIHADWPATRILMLTASETQDNVLEALEAGALSYALKGTPAPVLSSIVRATARGEAQLPASMLNGIVAALRSRDGSLPMLDRFGRLSPKEERTLRLLARGFSNREIADATGVQVKTVKFHLANIKSKLGVRNRLEAALVAQRIYGGAPELS
jgi:two-component system nitrate/nitrite response regulator NarL